MGLIGLFWNWLFFVLFILVLDPLIAVFEVLMLLPRIFFFIYLCIRWACFGKVLLRELTREEIAFENN